MQLLAKRRSLLDLLSAPNTEADTNGRPKTSNTLSPVPRNTSPTRPVSEHGFPRSRLSHEVRRDEVVDDTHEDAGGRAKRFSMLKFRNFSESHLAVRAKEDEKRETQRDDAPPMPAVPSNSAAVPAIVKTAPTMDHGEAGADDEQTERERQPRPMFKRSMSKKRSSNKRIPDTRKSMDEKRSEKEAKPRSLRWRRLQGRSTGLEDLARLSAAHINNQAAPPSYGDESNSALALPVSGRFSESDRSEASNSSDQIYGSTTTTTHTVSTHTTFFRLPRRNKNRNSLFPLPIKIAPPNDEQSKELPQDDPPTPRASTSFSVRSQQALDAQSPGKTPSALQRRHTESDPSKQPPLPANAAALAKQSLAFAEPGMSLFRNSSQRSRASTSSSPLQPPMTLGRDRASTTSSLGRYSQDMGTPPPLGSWRNSTSTNGRAGFGGLLNLSRFRQSSDPHSPRHSSPGHGSKSNSFAMSREALVVPEREEGDTPGKYLERLEAAVARSMIAGILSKSADPFAQAVLRSYTRRFPFFGEPIDMSLRKFLLEADLPKETQQVDRVIQAFADRYHECNPGIFVSPDQAYIIAFSLMMLHTDAFNKNNKRKMQKADYIKNTSGQDVSEDVLGCFYDNICYTPFIHFEEEVDINGERVLPFKPKKSTKVKITIPDASGKKPSSPVDPYNLLVDQKLDLVRPPIKDTITMEDPYNYRGPTQGDLDPHRLQRAFTHTGVLQIISQRSRPSAYEGQLTNSEHPNVAEMKPGIIDIKVTKVGTLWRKAAKKKKARSPWQEWGAILTGSQLYLFKNAHWAKGLVHQFTAAQRPGQPRVPVVFKPPLQEFKPDALIKTDDAVALVDSTYTRHKHAFTFVRPGGMEEVLLADNEGELNDWLGLINYAAAFKTAGVRIRGIGISAEEDQKAKELKRGESAQSVQSATQPANGNELTVQNRGLTPQLHRQIMAARRQIMVQKVGEAGKDITEANNGLDNRLRNARHLLILAPLTPKTRDDMIHAAARSDATIKWTRRDIWRMKCHKDILAMDVQVDGLSVSEVEALSAEAPAESSTAKKSRNWGLSRLGSKASAAVTGRSPPQSPTSPSQTTQHRPSTTGSSSLEWDDVFRTPPEESSTPSQSQGGEWRLPPLQLNVQTHNEEHRGSVASTFLTATSAVTASERGGRGSLSHASSASSVRPTETQRRISVEDENRGRRTPEPSLADDPQIEALARATMSPDRVLEPISTRGTNLDSTPGAASASTPESKPNRSSGVRRSLQKTLRDTKPHAHHGTSTHHKHKRGKESESTVRSATNTSLTAKSTNDEDKEAQREQEEGTPGLKREKGRFILHGKQASVVQFDGRGDWPNERMKARRELWRQNSATSPTSPSSSKDDRRLPERTFSYGKSGWRADMPMGMNFVPPTSPVVRDFTREESDEEPETRLGEAWKGADAARSGSPARMSSSGTSQQTATTATHVTDEGDPRDSVTPKQKSGKDVARRGSEEGQHTFFSSSSSIASSQQLDGEGGVGKRRTVIGPATPSIQVNGGAEREDEEDGDDDGSEMYEHVGDESRQITA